MYRTEPLFPYADKLYSIMPAGLPDRFYPQEKDRVYKTEHYVICFSEDATEDIKERLIRDYAEYYRKENESGKIF